MSHSRFQLNKKQNRYLRLKRILDILFSMGALLVLLIPFLVIALIQKISEPKEPVFFMQERIGKGTKHFRIIKFRSMKSAVGHYIPSSSAVQTGEMMTPFGKFLRDSSMDELPQLLQVLTGKMSVIGPRPLIPQEKSIHQLREEYGVYQLRPGITGWAQVNGRDKVKGEEKAALDREYMEKISFSMDVNILWRTVKTVIFRENTL